MGKYDELVERLKERTLPSAFAWTGPKVETLFDQGLRHKSGKSPSDYLAVWLSMLRPFAYATRDGSWGELEKLLCIVMWNYVEMCREADEAATAITTLQAGLAAMKARGDCGWLIEHPSVPMWLTLTNPCRDWTADSNEAVRFSRQRDAEAYIRDIGITGARATEHRWD